MTKTTQVITPSVLAFERRIDISDGFFWQLDSKSQNEATPISIVEKSVRGTISNRQKKAEEQNILKLDPAIENPNLQKIDSASLDEDKDTLLVRWSCKILPFDGKPCVCNGNEYQAKIMEIVKSYWADKANRKELTRRYAINIANGRWLWRNRFGAKNVIVTVKCEHFGKPLEFNSKDFNLNDFNTDNEQINQLAQIIETGFNNDKFVCLEVEARALVGYAQEVYPSQELVLDNKDNKKSKILYKVQDKAALHSQKISNAIRTIDDWYTDAQFPIATEPYGSVTTLGKAFRQPKSKEDFYSLLDNWIEKDNTPVQSQQHYIMSMLIRGGVFGKPEDKKNKKGEQSE